jgi:hypothetical protein
MENTETFLLEVTPQERLAYAWAVAQSHAYRSTLVSERLLARCREATAQLSTPDCWLLLSEVPALLGPVEEVAQGGLR